MTFNFNSETIDAILGRPDGAARDDRAVSERAPEAREQARATSSAPRDHARVVDPRP